MNKYARIENGVVREVLKCDSLYKVIHKDFWDKFILAPHDIDVKQGWIYDGKNWSKPKEIE